MRSVARLMLTATVAVGAVGLGFGSASAQGLWGPQAATKDMDPRVKEAADLMGIVRGANLVVGQVNVVEYDANGTMVDIEAATLGQPVPVTRYTYTVATQVPASRLDFEGPQTPRTIRVVKEDKAWDESWTEDKKLTTAPSDNNELRAQMMWLEPHAFMQAVAFASAKVCPDGSKCENAKVDITDEGGKTVFTVDINGQAYKGTLGADKRPERIETTVTMPDGSSKLMVALYADYRNGISIGKEALDKFHAGTYWPGEITYELDGTTVLDLTVTAGWSNPYSVFPDPELLAKAQ